jgi:hypothetical protein
MVIELNGDWVECNLVWNQTRDCNFSMEPLHLFPRDQLNKSHDGHVGVPDKRIELKFFWIGTPCQHGGCDVMCKRSICNFANFFYDTRTSSKAIAY